MKWRTAMNVMKTFALLVLTAVAVTALSSCGGPKRTATIVPGTQSPALPPLPTDVEVLVYKTDALFSKRCAAVPSGLNNCMDWLRHEADRRLMDVMERKLLQTQSSPSTSVSRGEDADGVMAEDRVFASELIDEMGLNMTFRKLEAPIFELSDGETYALRVVVVREEADYQLFTELAQKAESQGRREMAERFRTRLDRLYGDRPPDRSKIEAVERRVSEHFLELWNMARGKTSKRR